MEEENRMSGVTDGTDPAVSAGADDTAEGSRADGPAMQAADAVEPEAAGCSVSAAEPVEMPEAAGRPEAGAAPSEAAGQVAALETENEELKKSFTPLYTEIGRHFYEKEAGYELAITAAVEKLNGINDRIHDNYLATLRLKGIRYCPNCENIVDDETVFCGDCGTRIDPVGEADEQTVLCGCCGALNDKENHFCTKCGQRLEVQQTVSKRCPSCGMQLPADARFCEECGTRLN